MPWWAQGPGLLYVSLPAITLFAICWEEEYRKTKNLWRSALSALGQVLVGAVVIGFVIAIAYGMLNSSGTEDVCGYPWDC